MCGCAAKLRFKGYSGKRLITAAGDVQVTRRTYRCATCQSSTTPWDVWAGVGDDHLTPQVRRLAALAGSSWSFDVASRRLQELCGLRISDDVIRNVVNAAGQRAARWQQQAPPAARPLRQAAGNTEFYTDGTSVNTRGGWREIRLGVFAKREAGPAAKPREWATRKLPPPTARVAFAGLASAEEFGARWAVMAGVLGLNDGRSLTALADGAKWIWKQVAAHLPHGECVVDVFHVSQHLHDCGKALHGEKHPAARAWAEQRLLELIEHGPIRFLKALHSEKAAQRGQSRPARRRRAALAALAAYLQPNVDGLWYGSRLARGLPIGSGLIEGACKTIVGRRLKLNSARWNPDRAERLASLCCLLYGNQWDDFWNTNAA